MRDSLTKSQINTSEKRIPVPPPPGPIWERMEGSAQLFVKREVRDKLNSSYSKVHRTIHADHEVKIAGNAFAKLLNEMAPESVKSRSPSEEER